MKLCLLLIAMNKNNNKIYFVLNTLGLTGGVKVVFEHANLFSQKGYEVHIVHLLKLKKGLKGNLIGILKKIKYFFYKNKRPEWFSLNNNIIIHRWFSLNNKKLNGFLIATANETADWVNKIDSKNKFYFIQDYEVWTRDEKSVDKTYLYNLKQIVISIKIKSLLKYKFNKDVLGIVPNGIDYKYFSSQKKQYFNNQRILMLYHPLPKKGFETGLRAIKIVKNKFPNTKLIVFGAYKNPNNKIIDEFYFFPDKEKIRDLYQKSSIFFYPALEEGFGLTLLEAAAAKCAIVTTRVGWAHEYGENNKSFIFTEKDNHIDMAKKLINLIENKEIIIKLGNNANILSQQFSWERSNKIFEKLLIENSCSSPLLL